jgi:hypothetical protein
MLSDQLTLLDLDPATRAFYKDVLTVLTDAQVPFLVCGAFALQLHTGVDRRTKDLDVSIRPGDCERALRALSGAGYTTTLVFSHWLAKAFSGEDFVDIIFSSGNGLCAVDDSWFAHAVEGTILGVPVKICPPEESIWQKAFIMERERFDGADVAHLLRAYGRDLDWPRLLRLFGPHWRVLLAQLILFGFIYPAHRSQVPEAVLSELLSRLQAETSSDPPGDRVCQGTFLSRAQYLVDLERWGYRDARLPPYGHMTPREIQVWTDAIPDAVPGMRPR